MTYPPVRSCGALDQRRQPAVPAEPVRKCRPSDSRAGNKNPLHRSPLVTIVSDNCFEVKLFTVHDRDWDDIGYRGDSPHVEAPARFIRTRAAMGHGRDGFGCGSRGVLGVLEGVRRTRRRAHVRASHPSLSIIACAGWAIGTHRRSATRSERSRRSSPRRVALDGACCPRLVKW